jgi:hypothetical protein
MLMPLRAYVNLLYRLIGKNRFQQAVQGATIVEALEG